MWRRLSPGWNGNPSQSTEYAVIRSSTLTILLNAECQSGTLDQQKPVICMGLRSWQFPHGRSSLPLNQGWQSVQITVSFLLCLIPNIIYSSDDKQLCGRLGVGKCTALWWFIIPLPCCITMGYRNLRTLVSIHRTAKTFEWTILCDIQRVTQVHPHGGPVDSRLCARPWEVQEGSGLMG